MFFSPKYYVCAMEGGSILLDMNEEIGRMGASLITTWWIEEAILQQMEVELERLKPAGERARKQNCRLWYLMLDAWIPASAGILCIVLFQFPPLVNCLRARDTQKQISSQDKKFRQCRLFHSNCKCETNQKILTVLVLLYFPFYLNLHTVSRIPTLAAFSETVVRRTGSQDEKWEHQCLYD